MEKAALLSSLKNGEIDPTCLYNKGISLFWLDQVHAEVGRMTSEGIHRQNVHEFLDAEYFLQNEFDLPVKHDALQFPGQGLMNPERAQRIGERIKTLAAKNDFEKVREFMSTWEPWVDYMKSLPKHKESYEKYLEIYQDILEELQSDYEKPGSATNALCEKDYQEKLDATVAKRRTWEKEVTAELTRTFITNVRADYLMDYRGIPECLNGT